MSFQNLCSLISNPKPARNRSPSFHSLACGLAASLVVLAFSSGVVANDKVKQALKNYESRMEEERAKVIAVFEREAKIAERQRDAHQKKWLGNIKQAWMDNELVITERGGLRFFNGAEESFGTKDFSLNGDFKLKNDSLTGNNGNATIRLTKPARATYFRGMVESKNNFAIQLNQAELNIEKDIAIIVGGWNNSRSEIHLDGKMIATKPVGMPRRWLCEVYCQNQSVAVYANGAELLSAKIPRPVTVNLANISISYDSGTTVHSPVFKAK